MKVATNVLILGANGSIARIVTAALLRDKQIHLTLFLRRAERLKHLKDEPNVTVVEGDVRDSKTLSSAMAGQNIVYTNVDGPDMEDQMRNIVSAMNASGVRRIIFISAGGVYDELPGEFGRWNKQMLGDILIPYQKSVEVLEAAEAVNYTILRPVWLTNEDQVNYETTRKEEIFRGTEVSRKSVADLVIRLIHHPEEQQGESLGVNKPGTEGTKPAFYR